MDTTVAVDNLTEVCRLRAANLPIPPELAQRIRRDAELITARILKEHGVLDVAVELVREARSHQ